MIYVKPLDKVNEYCSFWKTFNAILLNKYLYPVVHFVLKHVHQFSSFLFFNMHILFNCSTCISRWVCYCVSNIHRYMYTCIVVDCFVKITFCQAWKQTFFFIRPLLLLAVIDQLCVMAFLSLNHILIRPVCFIH